MGTFGETDARLDRPDTGRETQRLDGDPGPSPGCRCAQTLSQDTKEQRAAQPRGWGPPGAHVRSPPTPRPRTRLRRDRPPKRTPDLAAGTQEPPGGRRRGALATGPGGSEEAGRGRASPPLHPFPARPPRRGGHAPRRHQASPPGAHPPGPAPPLLTRARRASASASPEPPPPPPSLWSPRPRRRHLGSGRK